MDGCIFMVGDLDRSRPIVDWWWLSIDRGVVDWA